MAKEMKAQNEKIEKVMHELLRQFAALGSKKALAKSQKP